MQDTAEGFGQPIRHIFGSAFRIERELPSPWDSSPRYRVHIEDRIWRALYVPLGRGVQRLADAVAVIQGGRLAVYLLYSLPHPDRAAGVRAVTALAMLRQTWEVVLAIALAPLFMGWIAQCRAWLQNRSAPPLLQPWRMLRKLFWKDAALAEHASPLFRATPYVLFGTMVLAAAIIPTVATRSSFAWVADAIALVGSVRHRPGLHLARGDGHRHRLRDPRRAAGDDDRLPGRAGVADGLLQRLPDLGGARRCPASSSGWPLRPSSSIRAWPSPAWRS